jgi:c-di-GMP-related signal transduction protein
LRTLLTISGHRNLGKPELLKRVAKQQTTGYLIINDKYLDFLCNRHHATLSLREVVVVNLRISSPIEIERELVSAAPPSSFATRGMP